MSHINVTINGRQYRMACEEGQEVRLLKLAESMETRVGELRGKFGEIGDARLTVMAALTVCDELLDANARIRSLENELETLRNVRVAAADRAKATQMATDIMNAQPDIKGFLGVCSTAGPGVAQAVQNAGKTGKVFTVGMGTPNDMKKYLQNGAASAGVLWDAKALGCLTAWAGQQLAQGQQFQPTQKVDACSLDNVTYDPSTKILLMGKPLTYTKDNVGDYNF